MKECQKNQKQEFKIMNTENYQRQCLLFGKILEKADVIMNLHLI